RDDGERFRIRFSWIGSHNSAFSRHDLPEVCIDILPRREGAGDTGCALHPRSRVQLCEKLRTRAYRFSGNTPASPAQWLYGLWRALLGDEFCLATVVGGLKVSRARLDLQEPPPA